jgi:pilus assembly protein Flp/PilA
MGGLIMARLAVVNRAFHRALGSSEEGQGLAEYGLILAGVAVLAIVAIFALGPKIGSLLNKISSSLG